MKPALWKTKNRGKLRSLSFRSLLPQFVVPENGGVGLQMALLGLTFTVQGAIIFGLLGYFSGARGQWLKTRPRVGFALDRVAGAVFIALALRLMVR